MFYKNNIRTKSLATYSFRYSYFDLKSTNKSIHIYIYIFRNIYKRKINDCKLRRFYQIKLQEKWMKFLQRIL